MEWHAPQPPWNPSTHLYPGGPHLAEVAATMEAEVLLQPPPPPSQAEIAAKAERQRARAEEQEHAREKWQKAIAIWEAQAIDALAAVADPTERLVRACTELPAVEGGELQPLIPKTWDDRVIAEWFVRVVKEPPNAPTFLAREGQAWRPRRRMAAWLFYQGSTSHFYRSSHFDGGSTSGPPRSIAVLEDGRAYYETALEPRAGERLAVGALREMTRLARLAPLDLPPRPSRPPDDALPRPATQKPGGCASSSPGAGSAIPGRAASRPQRSDGLRSRLRIRSDQRRSKELSSFRLELERLEPMYGEYARTAPDYIGPAWWEWGQRRHVWKMSRRVRRIRRRIIRSGSVTEVCRVLKIKNCPP